MSIHGVLGESTSYPKTYEPSVLYPISRQLGRDEIYQATGLDCQFEGLACGVDVWQAFELSWLDGLGVSQVAMAVISVPADSPNIVESKSLKLYLNSLNFTQFDDVLQVQSTICKDVSACVGAIVDVQIMPLDGAGLQVATPLGVCIDQAVYAQGEKVALTDDIDSSVLTPKQGELKAYQLYSNLLRSNCPVTNQPDWGTVQIAITTDKVVDDAMLLRYVLSYRQHNGFHEQCVERIFADLMVAFEPVSLKVQANYTRRGGIDINPVRAFGEEYQGVSLGINRLIRQ